MHGEILPLKLVDGVLEDARAAGFRVIRLYGGEPLLHRDLPQIVRRCGELGLKPYLTTNAVLLDRKIDSLFDVGLRDITVGFYGVDAAYDWYVQTPGLYKRVEHSIAAVRQRYADKVTLQMNWLLMRPSCNSQSLRNVCEFAERYNMKIQIDLIHYSLPYFTEGPDAMLQFRPEDRGNIEILVDELLALKEEKPDLFTATPEALRSIPDWLIKGPHMKVPCTAYEMVWIGADGTVQLCYVGFKLGNLHQQRLRDILCGHEYSCAARDAFMLNCPNCHCAYSDRIMRDRKSRLRYSAPERAALHDTLGNRPSGAIWNIMRARLRSWY
jgi:cyclic pyranopterin phosphate synthase